MKPDGIMPSRAFCSDEKQGYPIILIANHQILLDLVNGEKLLVIDNQLLRDDRDAGLFQNFDELVQSRNSVRSYSTAKAFLASDHLVGRVGDDWPEEKVAIAEWLFPEAFYFKREWNSDDEGGILNCNLVHAMPAIIKSEFPSLAAAQINAQMEFDRAFRTIVKEKTYRGNKILFISGIHIDISPKPEQLFPLTKFVPWAACIQNEQDQGYTLEQQEIYNVLNEQSTQNPYKIDLTEAIHLMEKEPEVVLDVDR